MSFLEGLYENQDVRLSVGTVLALAVVVPAIEMIFSFLTLLN
ncbi:hypothetical protein [Domibacillus iocasae]|nr:hypothetical protein [Domibacillus iocasae]